MPQHRHTIEFRPMVFSSSPVPVDTLGSVQGWTETWYDSADLADGNALDLTLNLANARKMLLPAGWRVYRLRVSRFPLTRTAARRSLTPTDGQGRYAGGAVSVGSEQPNDTLIFNISSATGKTRNFGMRGLPRGVISPGNNYLAPAFFEQALPGWTSYLKNNFSIATISPGFVYAIIGVSTATIGGFPMASSTPGIHVEGNVPLIFPGAKIRIAGVVGVSNLKGQWTVDASSVQTIDGLERTIYRLRQKRGVFLQGAWQQGGTLTSYTSALSAIAEIGIGEGGSRRTGGPSNRPRGRRSNRRS